MQKFHSNGKLLLTGEYLVLDSALALALPTKFGQTLQINPIDTPEFFWTSYDENKNVWFSARFILKNNDIVFDADNDFNSTIAIRLLQILNAVKRLAPNSFKKGFTIETFMDFPRNWGLGSSSTLINNIANWAKIDAFDLLELTFGGSGYDIACAQFNTPITYRINADKKRFITPIEFNPSFSNYIYFVHLNKKQNSREGITKYKSKSKNKLHAVLDINQITRQIIDCQDLKSFEVLINKHEDIISSILETPTIKTRLFPDYKGSIKSLGAWGGDFILATGSLLDMNYFKDKGYSTIISFKDMIL